MKNKIGFIMKAVAVVVFLLMFASCTKGESNMKSLVSSSETNINDLATKRYDEMELQKISSFKGTINELHEQYPVYCCRQTNNMYRISYLGSDRIVLLLFDNEGNKILSKNRETKLSKSDFSILKKGDPLEKVMEIDTEGEYLFLYTGRNDTPKESLHYTKDGFLITIKYNDNNLIDYINEELI